jgi:porin
MKTTRPRKTIASYIAAAGVLVLGLAQPTLAQETEPQQASGQPQEANAEQNEEFRSGFENVPEFGGSNSVGATLRKDNAVKEETVFRFEGIQRGLKPYFDWKGRIKEQHGLALGSDYTVLYQAAGESPGEKDAASGILRLFGTWNVLGRGTGNTGSLVYKIENRHKLGTNIVPQDLGFVVGYAGLTAAPFSDIRWALTNLNWQQKFKAGRVSFVAGIVDATDYVDIYGLTNPWTQFSNLAFLTDPTIPVPNQGLGAAVGAMATDHIYVVAGLADANGDPTDPGNAFESFFNDNEYFKHVEVGWTSSRERIWFDNIHLTAWQSDERNKAGVPEGSGWAFSFARFINEKWMPFVRAGASDGGGGALWERSVSTGFGHYMKGRRDLLGLGLNWSRPSEKTFTPGLRDQYTAEFFYRIQLSQNFAITPDVQLIIDPALNPAEDQIWIIGLRARLAL